MSADDIRRASRVIAGVVRETPVLSSRTLSERSGGTVELKAENLQRTGSFKLRGALAKIASLGPACERGVVTASAGNHAQAVAYAARERGVACEVFMPEGAPIGKVEATTALGAQVRLVGESVDEALGAAREHARSGGRAFVHPFDDPVVVAGQGGIGLELLEQVPELGRVVVPVGGGGLISGIAIALKSVRPDVEVVGVQVQACAPFPASLAAGAPVAVDSALTIADGIAVKRPGDLTLALIERWVDGIVVVSDEEVAEAMVFLMERAKLVVEGAGAVGVA
ncbi:MAG: threonine ammonia-lyase, partial [Solirubrobacteraceae bacterium]